MFATVTDGGADPIRVGDIVFVRQEVASQWGPVSFEALAEVIEIGVDDVLARVDIFAWADSQGEGVGTRYRWNAWYAMSKLRLAIRHTEKHGRMHP